MSQKHIRDYGVQLDCLPAGPHNKITDVPSEVFGLLLTDGTIKIGIFAKYLRAAGPSSSPSAPKAP